MSPPRASITLLMGSIALIALGFAALKNPTHNWAGAVFLLTVGVLLFALTGVFGRTWPGRLPWIGFSIFGWGYLALANWSGAVTPPPLPTSSLIAELGRRIHPPDPGKMIQPIMPPISSGPGPTPIILPVMVEIPAYSFAQIGHCLVALLCGLLGSFAARYFQVSPGRDDVGGVRPPP